MMRKYFIYMLAFLFLFSCSKEKSLENGGGTNTVDPPLGNNCTVNQIITADSLTGQGLFSYFTKFNISGIAESVEIYDSISGTMQFQGSLQYKGDTIRVSPSDYFLTDANKRVRGFRTTDFSGTPGDTLSYVYKYDVNGYLTEKEIFITGIVFPILRYSFVWSGQNLVAIDGVVAVPGINQKVMTVTLEYDAGKTAKNFLQVMPDGFENALYIMGLDLGKKSRNIVKKYVVTLYDDQGALDEAYTMNFSNYKFSSDGYLTEWYAVGEDAGGTPFQSGRTLFKYFCK
jgi:hypothetical protein